MGIGFLQSKPGDLPGLLFGWLLVKPGVFEENKNAHGGYPWALRWTLFYQVWPERFDHQGQKSGHKNSHGHAIRTRGYRGRLKLVFEDLAVERQARILDDDLHRNDFCHLYASLVKLYKRSGWFEQITTLIQ